MVANVEEQLEPTTSVVFLRHSIAPAFMPVKPSFLANTTRDRVGY